MTSPTGRVYAVVLALVVFLLAWTLVAARPWQSAADPRVAALEARRAQLEHDAALVQAVLAARGGPAPAVRVVELPPLTVTRSS